ncbi:peptidase inhibitor family I36 protein [Streptomyces sp. NPDC002156]
MTRTKITTALAAVGLTALFAVVGAAPASGIDRDLPSPVAAAPAAIAADGNLYAWQHENKGGRVCSWAGNDNNWTTCSPGAPMRNVASSLLNNGYTHDVWLYYGPNQTGAQFCLQKGQYLENIVHYYFPNNGTGGGTSLNDNIASHAWVADC